MVAQEQVGWRKRYTEFFGSIYEKILKINDSPQKIAIGFGLGVFMGIMPGVGPVAALVMAFFFRVNRVAAFIGGLLTNTWLSLITFILAVRIGSAVTGLDWETVSQNCKVLLNDFHWNKLFQSFVFDIFVPLVIGYAVVGLGAAVASYLVIRTILKQRKNNRKKMVEGQEGS